MSQNRPWSKLQSALYNIVDPAANFQIHCNAYEYKSRSKNGRSYKMGRYWITIGKDIIFDYPKMFLEDDALKSWNPNLTVGTTYPSDGGVPEISKLIRNYIDTPKEELLTKDLEDIWGITEIFKLVDRRVGKNTFKKIIKINNLNRMIDEKYLSMDLVNQIFQNRWGNDDKL